MEEETITGTLLPALQHASEGSRVWAHCRPEGVGSVGLTVLYDSLVYGATPINPGENEGKDEDGGDCIGVRLALAAGGDPALLLFCHRSGGAPSPEATEDEQALVAQVADVAKLHRLPALIGGSWSSDM